MNSSQAYKPGTPVTASPANDANSVISRTAQQKAWWISVSVQDAYLSFNNTTALTSTFGCTFTAGFSGFVPIMGDISCRAVTTGAIVNAIPLE